MGAVLPVVGLVWSERQMPARSRRRRTERRPFRRRRRRPGTADARSCLCATVGWRRSPPASPGGVPKSSINSPFEFVLLHVSLLNGVSADRLQSIRESLITNCFVFCSIFCYSGTITDRICSKSQPTPVKAREFMVSCRIKIYKLHYDAASIKTKDSN